MFSPIDYEPGNLRLIDQRVLPGQENWLECRDVETVATAISEMVVRGAPAIGCTAAFGLALDAGLSQAGTWGEYEVTFKRSADLLASTRPTAVNLFFAIEKMKAVAEQFSAATPMEEVKRVFDREALSLYRDDQRTCQAIGENALSLVDDGKVRVLTHCNAGALATAGYGTAVGVITSLHEAGRLEHAWVDETRPWLQGARLTAFELHKAGIPFTLNADSASGYVMSREGLDWVVVGADRIAANGDTANKIGTYNLAVLARFHGIKFYVAAPFSTFDLDTPTGAEIPVEMRAPEEITTFRGARVAPEDISVLNPSFDVTPAHLISGIITEKGVITEPWAENILGMMKD